MAVFDCSAILYRLHFHRYRQYQQQWKMISRITIFTVTSQTREVGASRLLVIWLNNVDFPTFGWAQ